MALRDPVSCEQMQQIISQFRIDGRVSAAGPYGSGHINDTFAVTVTQPSRPSRRYILQRINTTVFQNVAQLMDNISRVTAHVRAALQQTAGSDPDREALTLIATRAGEPYLRDHNGDCWRAYIFIEQARSYDVLETPQQAFAAAQAFARFQKLLADLPAPPLFETIEGFHHTPGRAGALEQAIAADVCGRAAECAAEISFIRSFRDQFSRVTDGLENGTLPWRVTHNDTKLNNVLIDDNSGHGVCVIDLDTVMPGSALYDFGDLIRTSTGHFAENETDLSKVQIDMERFTALASGYLSAAEEFLTPAEIDLLPFSGLLITLEIGMRFLTDFLQGDTYFRIHHPCENLDRARCQFGFARSIAAHQQPMRQVVLDCCNQARDARSAAANGGGAGPQAV